MSGLDVPPNMTHLSDECLESLYKNLDLFLVMDVCDEDLNMVYADLLEILQFDPFIKHTLPQFFNLIRPIETSISGVQAAMKMCSVEHLRGLRKQYNLILQLHDSSCEGGSLDDEQRGILRIGRGVYLQMAILEELIFLTRISQVMLGINLVTEEEKFEPLDNKARHLCISNGFEMWCLHLKPEDAWPVQFAELKLVAEYVAVSAGLFKLGSDAYIIGGLQSDNYMEVQSINAYPLERYTSLCRSYCSEGVEASSRDTYRLSLSSDGASLNRPNCSTLIGQLNKPKFWPIVEKIDGQIHVIDSLPSMLHHFDITPNWKFTHEVLYPGDDTWTEMETIVDDGNYEDQEDYGHYEWDHSASYIQSHLVIGNHIYALAQRKYLVFDSKNWEASPRTAYDVYWKDPFSVKQVRNILELGMAARCVGEFPLGEGRETLYMVIAVCSDRISRYGTLTLAYLVTLAGEVVCFQRLAQRRLLPTGMTRATIIQVEEEDEKEGKKAMYCVIVNGEQWSGNGLEFLAINTFQVEALTENAGEVGQIRAQGKEVGWPVEHDFVRLVVKDMYEYKLSQQTCKGGVFYFPHMQACFL